MKKFIKLYCIDFECNTIIESTYPTVISTDSISSIREERIINNTDGQYFIYTRIILKDCEDDIFTYETVNKIYSLMESE